jgi:F-type H+-transporting ATPase subunit epsilon
MKTFKLKIITPEKVFFDSETQQVTVRTTEGDIGVLYGHENYVANLPAGPLKVKINGEFREAAISGGVIKVSKEETVVLAMAAEWADEIDLNWAKRSQEDAMRRIKESQSDYEMKMAERKLKRALNRINISGSK